MCEPGALLGGPIYERGSLFAADADGHVLRGVRDWVRRLGTDLTTVLAESGPLSSMPDPRPYGLAVDADGAASIIVGAALPDSNPFPATLVHTSPALDREWSADFQVADGIPLLSASTSLVVASFAGSSVFALDAATGNQRWTASVPGLMGIAASPDGDVIAVGNFTGSIDLGNSVVLATTAQMAGYVASIGADGRARWAVPFQPDSTSGETFVSALNLGPGGEISIGATWVGGAATLLGARFAERTPNGTMVAVLSPDGTAVLWAAETGTFAGTLVTDGRRVVTGCSYLAASGASDTGATWSIVGSGDQPLHVLAMTPSATLASFEVEGPLEYGGVRADGTGVAIVKLAP